jgi:hypothetical protein
MNKDLRCDSAIILHIHKYGFCKSGARSTLYRKPKAGSYSSHNLLVEINSCT